jgi:uncharacterized repeat protein (TIGR02543 family)
MAPSRIRNIFICTLLSLALVLGGDFVVYGDAPVIARPGADTPASAGLPGLSDLSDLVRVRAVTNAPVQGAEYDGYIVKVAPGALSKDLRAMKKYANTVIGDELAIVDRPEDALRFADAGEIEAIEPNYKLTAFAFPETDPADPLYTAPNEYQWGVKYVKAQAAWRAGYRGEGVNIAIMDSGLVRDHVDLADDKVLSRQDWVNGSPGADDDNMHGSVVGGIIAADIDNIQPGTTNSGIGMAGIVDKSSLFIHKVLDRAGAGSMGDILYAYYDILESGDRIDVVNLSLGHVKSPEDKIEDEVIQKLIRKGVIVVAATGNNGDKTDGTKNEMNYPAGYENVIGVGSVGKSGLASGFSTKNKSVDVTAPGELMVGLEYGTKDGYYANYFTYNGSLYSLDGTSFAAPVVAAAAAIAKQRDRNIDAGAFLTALKRTSRDGGLPGYDTVYGYGVLDIENLVNYLNTASVTLTFDANGGRAVTESRTVWPGGKYGGLPTPTRGKYGFGGWYTAKKGGVKITDLSTVAASATGGLTLYAHWQDGTTLGDLTAGAGKLKPAFSYKKTNYTLTLPTSRASVKITPAKSYAGAKLQIKVGDGKYGTKKSVTVKLKKGKSKTVYIKLSKKGLKTRTYKIKVKRNK